MKAFRTTCFIVLASFVAACTIGPSNTVPKRATNDSPSFVKPAVYSPETQVSAQPKPQKVTFPDMVKKSPLVTPKAEELNLYQEALKLLEEEGFTTQAQKDKAEKPEKTNSGQAQRAYPTLFKTKINPKSKYQIQIPSTGEFKLVVKEGTGFGVVDNNATDGSASITMPRGTLKTAIQMHGAKSQNSQMEVNDQLYYIQDVLDTRQWDKWMDIGLRPMPVPTDWRSEDGNDFVLRFKSQAIQSFHMVWQSEEQKAPFPPGINEIGPEGGTVELSGIGKIELPEGALTETITVKLSQQKESYRYSEDEDYICDFASPILKIEPLNLRLAKPGLIYLKINKERLGNNSPDVIRWFNFSNPEDASEEQFNLMATHKDGTTDDWDKIPASLYVFRYYAMGIRDLYTPTSGADIYPPRKYSSNSFQTQQISVNTSESYVCEDLVGEDIFEIEGFDVFQSVGPQVVAKKDILLAHLGQIFKSYCSKFKTIKPKLWYPLNSEEKNTKADKKILVNFSGSPKVTQHKTYPGRSTLYLPILSEEWPADVAAHEIFHIFQVNHLVRKDAEVVKEELPMMVEGPPTFLAHHYASNVEYTPFIEKVQSSNGLNTVLNQENNKKILGLNSVSDYEKSLLNSHSYMTYMGVAFNRLGYNKSLLEKLSEGSTGYVSAPFFASLNHHAGDDFIYKVFRKFYTDTQYDKPLIETKPPNPEKETIENAQTAKIKKYMSDNKFIQTLESELGVTTSLAESFHTFVKDLAQQNHVYPYKDLDFKKVSAKISSTFDFLSKISSPTKPFKKPDFSNLAADPNNALNFSINKGIPCFAYDIFEKQLTPGSPAYTISLDKVSPENPDLKVFVIEQKKEIVDEQEIYVTIGNPKEVFLTQGLDNPKYTTANSSIDRILIAVSNGKHQCNAFSGGQALTEIEATISPSIHAKSTKAGDQSTNKFIAENDKLEILVEVPEKFKCLRDNAPTGSDCKVVFESKVGSRFIPGEVNTIKDEELNAETQIRKQSVYAKVPNGALKGGSVYIYKENGIESNVLEDATYVCNMLESETELKIQSEHIPHQLQGCKKR